MSEKPIQDKDLEGIAGGGGTAFGDTPQPPAGGGGGGDGFGGAADKAVGTDPVEDGPSTGTDGDGPVDLNTR